MGLPTRIRSMGLPTRIRSIGLPTPPESVALGSPPESAALGSPPHQNPERWALHQNPWHWASLPTRIRSVIAVLCLCFCSRHPNPWCQRQVMVEGAQGRLTCQGGWWLPTSGWGWVSCFLSSLLPVLLPLPFSSLSSFPSFLAFFVSARRYAGSCDAESFLRCRVGCSLCLGMVRIVPALLRTNGCLHCQGQNNSHIAVIYFWLRKSECYKSLESKFSRGVGGGGRFQSFSFKSVPMPAQQFQLTVCHDKPALSKVRNWQKKNSQQNQKKKKQSERWHWHRFSPLSVECTLGIMLECWVLLVMTIETEQNKFNPVSWYLHGPSCPFSWWL